MLQAHAGRTHADALIIVESVSQICARARRVSPAVLQAFAKRVATLAPQLPHNGALACLSLLHQLAQQSKAVSMLLKADSEAGGSGRFDPTLPSPEHCNAHAAALHELSALTRHYHPTVRSAAGAVLRGNMPQDLNKMSSAQIFNTYDGSEMAFKPAIPAPTRNDTQNKKVAHTHNWAQNSLKEMCQAVENSVQMVMKDEEIK